jgi:hypothetical protein
MAESYIQHHFQYDQRGVRVPALVICPLIPRGVIDHTVYDRTSMLASVEPLFRMRPLTNRDKAAEDFLPRRGRGARRGPRSDRSWPRRCHAAAQREAREHGRDEAAGADRRHQGERWRGVLSRTRRRKRETRLDVGVVYEGPNAVAVKNELLGEREVRESLTEIRGIRTLHRRRAGRTAATAGRPKKTATSTARFGPAFMQHSEACTSR